MRTNKDQMGGGKQTSELPPGELERRKLLAKLSEFVADSDLSILRIAQLMGVAGPTAPFFSAPGTSGSSRGSNSDPVTPRFPQ